MFLLLLVLVLGKDINGARSWFELGPFSLQPSEFAKFGTALALANFLNNRRNDLTKMKVIIPAVAIILLPALLTAIQPDLGSTIVFFSFFHCALQGRDEPFYLYLGIADGVTFLSHSPV